MEKGYHSRSLKEITGAVKISKGSLYHYFDSKELVCNRKHCLDGSARIAPEPAVLLRAWRTYCRIVAKACCYA
ncbi:MAG: TetR/AcrR family transcriptional regulator [Methylococcales bacterium]|nr:TetR/AcrR family transcriptional regulator [Methylococcales bacterium]